MIVLVGEYPRSGCNNSARPRHAPMNLPNPFVTLIVLMVAAGLAHAQTGTLDQNTPFSPPGNAVFNANQPYVWQQQVRAGQSGRLEGIVIEMDGPVNASVEMNLRMGPAWNTSPAAFH